MFNTNRDGLHSVHTYSIKGNSTHTQYCYCFGEHWPLRPALPSSLPRPALPVGPLSRWQVFFIWHKFEGCFLPADGKPTNLWNCHFHWGKCSDTAITSGSQKYFFLLLKFFLLRKIWKKSERKQYYKQTQKNISKKQRILSMSHKRKEGRKEDKVSED